MMGTVFGLQHALLDTLGAQGLRAHRKDSPHLRRYPREKSCATFSSGPFEGLSEDDAGGIPGATSWR